MLPSANASAPAPRHLKPGPPYEWSRSPSEGGEYERFYDSPVGRSASDPYGKYPGGPSARTASDPSGYAGPVLDPSYVSLMANMSLEQEYTYPRYTQYPHASMPFNPSNGSQPPQPQPHAPTQADDRHMLLHGLRQMQDARQMSGWPSERRPYVSVRYRNTGYNPMGNTGSGAPGAGAGAVSSATANMPSSVGARHGGVPQNALYEYRDFTPPSAHAHQQYASEYAAMDMRRMLAAHGHSHGHTGRDGRGGGGAGPTGDLAAQRGEGYGRGSPNPQTKRNLSRRTWAQLLVG